MYVPLHFRPADEAAADALIEEHGFAVLISVGSSGDIHASHVPIELDLRGGTRFLIGHLARANRQWRTLDPERQALAIFRGPHAYVSPTWYDHLNVPTWNYAAVHAYGRPRAIEDRDRLLALVERQVVRYEPPAESPYRATALPPELLERELRGIVGFEIEVTRLVGALKLSQHRHPGDHANVVRRLEERGDAGSRGVAGLMRRTGPRPGGSGKRP